MSKTKHKNKELILELYYSGVSPVKLSEEYHIPQSTLFYWISKYPKEIVLNRPRSSIKGLSRMMSHTKKIEEENSFLKRTVVAKIPLQERLAIIDDEYGKESLHVQCEALDVSRGTYLNHKNRNKNENAWFKLREAEYSAIISEIYEKSGHIYGAKKIAAIMKKQGKPVTYTYVRRLMAENGLISRWNTSNKDRIIASRSLAKASHASSDFNVTKINQVWVSDTSAIKVHDKFYYLCVYIDIYSRKVVGWKLGTNNSTQLVKKAFISAYKNRGNPKSLIIHTDNGACYSSYSFNKLLRKIKVSHSYSRARIPHDNAVAESFFNIMKREAIYLNTPLKSYNDLKRRISEFIVRYNSVRPHEHLNYDSPDKVEKQQS
ncbi:IS3 family transposase [Candidatus Saccharibacteria bacterium]|nr:IS3 family transposase [Candidatus Saccharibacteria bacterium]